MKNKKKKETKREKLKKNKVSGHPVYIYKKVGRKYEFIGTKRDFYSNIYRLLFLFLLLYIAPIKEIQIISNNTRIG